MKTLVKPSLVAVTTLTWMFILNGQINVAQTIINVPPDPAPTFISGDTVLNLAAGGSLPSSFDALSGSVLNIDGGDIGFGFRADNGSTVNVRSGTVGRSFSAGAGSTVNITGGTLVGAIHAEIGSNMHVSGGNFGEDFKASGTIAFYGNNFLIDNAPLEELKQLDDSITLELPIRSQLVGVLADGTPFSFSFLDNDLFQFATVTLTNRALPPIINQQIDLPAEPAPNGVRNGQTLFVNEGSVIGDDFHATTGSKVIIQGGNIGDNFEVAGGNVDIIDGSIGNDFGVFAGSIVNIHGGTVGRSMRPLPGSSVNILGGHVESVFIPGASKLSISGGTIARYFWARIDAEVIISGEDFRVNGILVEGLGDVGDQQPVELASSDVLSGTLSDGTPFAFASKDHDTFEKGTLTLARTETPPIIEKMISLPESPTPKGIRTGQTLVVGNGGALNDSFNAGRGSEVIVNGGAIGNNFEAVGAIVNLIEGEIGSEFDAFGGTNVTVVGGTIGESFYVGNGSSISLYDGQIGQGLEAAYGSVVNISGGIVDFVRLQHGAQATISGGLVNLVAYPDAVVELVGTQFLLDGIPIPGLNSPGDSIVLANRNGEFLQAMLSDGIVNDYILRGPSRTEIGNFSAGSTLRLTLIVPEPAPQMLFVVALVFSCVFRRSAACRI